jgi:hypothetical protein
MDSRLPRRSRPHVARGPARARSLPRRPAPHPAIPPARQQSASAHDDASSPLLRFTRHGIPALTVLAGVVAMCFGTDTSLVGGAGLIGAGIAIWLVAWLYRLGVQGDSARDAEERARQQFDRTGRWPQQ